ncbi:MAG: hypothetical protein H3C71_06155, partial [Flavobacteriales bacterium]|nr:hypothetical protein [Flavobacteriales bacterium]
LHLGYLLKQHACIIHGPEAPPIGRIRNRFLFRILVKMQTGSSYHTVKDTILQAIMTVRKTEAGRKTEYHIDVDPY